MKYVSFPWLPVEAAISILKLVSFLDENISFERELIKPQETAINAKS